MNFEEAAIASLREMVQVDYEKTQTEPNVFIHGKHKYTVPPIPMWANHLHEHGIGVKYGAWGYERESI